MDAPVIHDVVASPGFIQSTEVWLPDAPCTRLVRADGLYGVLARFGEESAGESFGLGEGLPGLAWTEERPVLLEDLGDPAFRRGEAAKRAGLGAAIAIPVFARGALKGVLVMFFAAGTGAVEIWRGEGDEMRLDAGFYGAAAGFREASTGVTFQRGQGLPGGVWGAGAPILMQDLSRSRGFLRAEAAEAAGLTVGLGIPVALSSGAPCVVTLLSAPATPVARRFEIWDVAPGRGGRQAVAALADGVCDVKGAIFDSERRLLPWQGTVGRAMATGAPVAEAHPAALPGTPHYAGAVALPLHSHGEVTRVVAWFL